MKNNMKKTMNKTVKSNIITFGMVIIAFVIVQAMIMTGNLSSLMEDLMIPVCMYIILAVSLNLTVGILGELSLGHAGFMCVGAVTSGFFTRCMEDLITNGFVRFIIALVIGAAAAGVCGILIGIPVLRLRGDYLAIVTLAFGEIIKNVVNVLYIGRDSQGFHFSMKDQLALGLEPGGDIIISGAQGISRISKDATFTIAFVLVIITLIIVINIVNSRTGRAVMAIRDNRIAAESVGINITKYKMLAFSVSAALAGIGGVLYAHNLGTVAVTQKNFGYNMSIMILVFVVLGGIGNIRGSIIAAVVLTLLPEMLRFLNDYRMLIYAVVLIVMMLITWSPKIKDLRSRLPFGKLSHKKNIVKEAE